MMENVVRPLTEKERRLLNGVLFRRQRRLATLRRRMLVIGSVLFGALWSLMMIATLLDKKGPTWYASLSIAFSIALPISVWSYLSLRPKLFADVCQVEGALRRNEARVIRIQSQAMVEFEEIEDEGASYAFQLDKHRIVFVSGQDFYPSARFPNTDFSLVSIYGDDNILVEAFIEKQGNKLQPLRTVSSEQKSRMMIPSHLETIEGDLNRVEQLLASDGRFSLA
jgi:hypothetical protein